MTLLVGMGKRKWGLVPHCSLIEKAKHFLKQSRIPSPIPRLEEVPVRDNKFMEITSVLRTNTSRPNANTKTIPYFPQALCSTNRVGSQVLFQQHLVQTAMNSQIRRVYSHNPMLLIPTTKTPVHRIRLAPPRLGISIYKSPYLGTQPHPTRPATSLHLIRIGHCSHCSSLFA